MPCNHPAPPAVRKSMKSILLFLTVSTALLAQPVSFGLKGGVPLTDFIDTVSGSKTSITTTNRYIVGPTIELRLPAGFGVEADALYRHFTAEVQKQGIEVATGRFQQHMLVELVNDGPVTLLLDTRREF